MLDAAHVVRIYKQCNNLLIITNKRSIEFITKIICILPKLYEQLLPMVPILKQFLEQDYDGMVASMWRMYLDKDKARRVAKVNDWITCVSDTENSPVITALRSTLSDYERYLVDYTNRIEQTARDIRNAELKLLDAISNPVVVDPAVVKTFLDNPYITNFEYQGSQKLYIQLRAPVSDYDADHVRILLKSSMTNDINKTLNNRILAWAIFMERKYTMFCEERWRFDFLDMEGVCVDRVMHPNMACRNPHIKVCSCYKSYKAHICKSMQRRDYISMLTYALTCTGSINFADTPVVPYVFSYLLEDINSKRLLVDSEGNPVSVKELLDKEKPLYEVFENEQKAAQ
jgi:hypothetical protein